ncbi:MAG TPA: hypothetical protein VJB94_01750 [Candidatus Nanoarchaeia archaeon]|nr:hypothetical protein [Candidatus Nanoarchaeia archaeon]
MPKTNLTNRFFDINKLPPEDGILVFPISMSRISNAQNAKKCWEYVKIFSPEKIIKPLVGLNFIYGDYLYFNSEERASKLKNRFTTLILSHKNEFTNIISKNQFYILKAFSFITWGQTLLECKDFTNYIGQLNKLYKKDKRFRRYIKEDLLSIRKTKLDKNQLNFFLEEALVFYLIIKGKIELKNEYIQGHQKWVLWCYPGKPLKSQIYLVQKNFLGLRNSKNAFEYCFYDLEERKLYDFRRVDLESLKFA